ncbi:MAG: lipid-A-disaccharide synthase [Candidatus Krumholzibacteriota bacterium]|nr:lipid-A-disaccharide synthase [Candidatus Krumholzibacteriota bacterium]
MPTILLTCGETSGDQHAAMLVRELFRLDPSTRIIALGGPEVQRAGAEVRYPMDRYAFMGFSEIIHGIPRVLSLERRIGRLFDRKEIDLFVPVDYPGMNLRLAARASNAGVPVLYFIGPQVWAWGRWRLGRMRRVVDRIAVILPFEEELYAKAGIPAEFVGHPMLGEIPAPPAPKEAPARKRPFDVLLFPGSRKHEAARTAAPLGRAAELIGARRPDARFVVGLAPLIDESMAPVPASIAGRTRYVRDGIDHLPGAALSLACSGTVTLQSALSGTPTVVLYRSSAFSHALGRCLVRIPWIAMPNVLANRRIVPELIQGDATGERVAAEALGLLDDAGRYRRMSSDLIDLRRLLDGPGAARVAEIALEMAGTGGA